MIKFTYIFKDDELCRRFKDEILSNFYINILT